MNQNTKDFLRYLAAAVILALVIMAVLGGGNLLAYFLASKML